MKGTVSAPGPACGVRRNSDAIVHQSDRAIYKRMESHAQARGMPLAVRARVHDRFDQLGKKLALRALLGLVVASELPADPSTLLVRIMAGGRQLASAVRELAALPVTAYERIVAEPVLLDFQHRLEAEAETRVLDPDEQELIMVMHKSWEDARAEGRAEGCAEARAETLRKQVVLKFGELSPEHDRRIQAASPAELDRYLERVLFADSIDAVFA